MKNSLKELLQLNYKVEIEKIPDSEGGGYCASIPLLGKNACRGDGDTVEEAYESLDSIKEYLFNKWLSEGTNIPVPLNDNKEHGIEKEYYENGKVKEETPYENGKINGIRKEYYENGQLKSEALYYDDKLMNSSRYYYKNGEHISKRK